MIKTDKLSPWATPGRDIFYPHILRDPEGFIVADPLDGGIPGRIEPAVSITGLRQLAKKHAGMFTREEYDQLKAANAALGGRLDTAQAELDELKAKFDAIDVLASADFRARNKTGRKPKGVSNG